MDIQFAYNLERVLWFASGGDGATVGATIRQLEATGKSHLEELLRQEVGGSGGWLAGWWVEWVISFWVVGRCG